MPKLRGGDRIPDLPAVIKPEYRWKPGQSGNPEGRAKGSRNRFSEDFIADLHDAWRLFGRPALMTTALTDPSTFVRVAATLIPRDVEITVTIGNAERFSDDELAGYLERPDSADTAEAA